MVIAQTSIFFKTRTATNFLFGKIIYLNLCMLLLLWHCHAYCCCCCCCTIQCSLRLWMHISRSSANIHSKKKEKHFGLEICHCMVANAKHRHTLCEHAVDAFVFVGSADEWGFSNDSSRSLLLLNFYFFPSLFAMCIAVRLFEFAFVWHRKVEECKTCQCPYVCVFVRECGQLFFLCIWLLSFILQLLKRERARARVCGYTLSWLCTFGLSV